MTYREEQIFIKRIEELENHIKKQAEVLNEIENKVHKLIIESVHATS